MFNSGVDNAVERGIAWLEQLVDVVIKLINAIVAIFRGDDSSTTSAK